MNVFLPTLAAFGGFIALLALVQAVSGRRKGCAVKGRGACHGSCHGPCRGVEPGGER